MHRALNVVTVFLIVGSGSADSILAAETQSVRWHQDPGDAWRESQEANRPLLIFVTRADCLPCAKMKIGTYTDRNVAATINQQFVALTLDGAAPSPLIRDLAVAAYPVTFVVSPEAVILQRIDGYVSPQQMSARLLSAVEKSPARRPVQPVSGRAF